MAVGKAICKCQTCGTEFVMRKEGFSKRSEADKWEKWASDHYTLCTDCWKKRKKEEKQAKGFSYKVIPIKNGYNIALHGDTFTIKDKLKNLGYKWDGSVWYQTLHFIDFEKLSDEQLELLTHYRTIKEDKIDALFKLFLENTLLMTDSIAQIEHDLFNIQEIKDSGLVVDDFLKIAYGYNTLPYNVKKEKWLIGYKQARNADNIAEKHKSPIYNYIELAFKEQDKRKEDTATKEHQAKKPSKPEWLIGRWNGKIYGEKVKRIYLDNEEFVLNEEKLLELGDYLNCLIDWTENE